ncbi:DUF2442 domain-containing protein [Azospirillum halopraeferens]|uniref:DUF2442 domain-containing protein n=1 Tax=Azospirillum halopraeferens TaxID=34010 RepID=UPI0003F62891|nr:DUF2442 domain-containing protein [Azospirillum halopraeferens]
MYGIADATPHRDFTVTIRWKHGAVTTVDFKPTIAKGGVFTPMADPAFFESRMYVAEDGYYLGWPEEIDFSADSLWYRTHPDDLKRDYPDAAAE